MLKEFMEFISNLDDEKYSDSMIELAFVLSRLYEAYILANETRGEFKNE